MHPVPFVEKVRRPDSHGLARERLEQRLLSPERPPVALVLGPAGSGKTTLVSRVAERSSEPVAWYRATAEDRDEASVVQHIAYAVQLGLGGRQLPSAPPDAGGLVGWLSAVTDRPLSLVLDDVHELAGSAAEGTLARLVDHRPRHLRLVLAGRRPPALNISRLLVSGVLDEIDNEQLRFRSWEVEELFRSFYGQPLSPEAAAALAHRIEGWAAGLQLFHLSTAGMGRGERERAVDGLSGRSRLVRSYLARNVLDQVTPELRGFLLATSALGVMTGDTCDALLERSGSGVVLGELEQQHFLTTTEDDGVTYRYHQVLQTHLDVVLVDELGTPAARRLYTRSADLLERAGRTNAAVRAHVHAENWAAVARLLRQSATSLPAHNSSWVALAESHLPADDPGLVAAGARRLLSRGSVEAAATAYARAAALADDPDFRTRCLTESSIAAVWSSQVQPDRGSHLVDRRLSLASHLRHTTISVRPAAATGGPIARGAGQFLAGRRTVALATFERALDQAAGDSQRLGVRLAAIVAEVVGQRFSDVVRQLELVLGEADDANLPWLGRIVRGLRAALMLALNGGPAHAAACESLLADCERDQDRWGEALLGLAVGAAYAYSGQHAQADRTLAQAGGVAADLGAPVLQVWVLSLRHDPTARLDPETVDLVRRSGVDWDRLVADAAALRLAARPPAEPTTIALGRIGPPARLPAATPRPSPPVGLRCLGAFELSVDGRPFESYRLRPRARSLLMLMSMSHGRRIHREHLVDTLWPDANLESGVRSLQVAVSTVRQCLLAGGVVGDPLRRFGDAYTLQLGNLTNQLADFEAGAKAANQSRSVDQRRALELHLAALALYSGDLLPEAGPAEWVVGERDRLRTLAARLGSDAADLALAGGDLAAGVASARRSIELDPYHDRPWLVLAQLQEVQGDVTAAAHTRREHAAMCADFGLTPTGTSPVSLRPRRSRQPVQPGRPRAGRAPA